MWTTQAIALSSYEGWVAWVDGSPIFEHTPHNARLAQAVPGAKLLSPNQQDRNTLEWKNLPHEQIERVELYFDRLHQPRQPRVLLQKEEGADIRFFQMKMGGILQSSMSLTKKAKDLGTDELHKLGIPMGQNRLGVQGYRIGFWVRAGGNWPLQSASMIEVEYGNPNNIERTPVKHPCWPKPWGYGLAPHVVGITEADIPPCPHVLTV